MKKEESLIKIGEYIRTRLGKFDKFIRMEHIRIDDKDFYKFYCENEEFFDDKIPEHSFDLAQLVHPGDRVNGKVVVKKEYNTVYGYLIYLHGGYMTTNRNIKTIIAKDYLQNGTYNVKEVL